MRCSVRWWIYFFLWLIVLGCLASLQLLWGL